MFCLGLALLLLHTPAWKDYILRPEKMINYCPCWNFDCSSHINWKIYRVAGYGGTVHEVCRWYQHVKTGKQTHKQTNWSIVYHPMRKKLATVTAHHELTVSSRWPKWSQPAVTEPWPWPWLSCDLALIEPWSPWLSCDLAVTELWPSRDWAVTSPWLSCDLA